jgi:anti-anti-sigma regulatory factor
MLRITEVSSSDGNVTLLLEGRVTGQWAEEVRRVCEEYLDAGLRLTLDLSEVSHVGCDESAIFQELDQRKVRFINCSPFLVEYFRETLAASGSGRATRGESSTK